MEKILNKYKANPTTENLSKVRFYALRHPFSVMMLNMDDQKFLYSLGL